MKDQRLNIHYWLNGQRGTKAINNLHIYIYIIQVRNYSMCTLVWIYTRMQMLTYQCTAKCHDHCTNIYVCTKYFKLLITIILTIPIL